MQEHADRMSDLNTCACSRHVLVRPYVRSALALNESASLESWVGPPSRTRRAGGRRRHIPRGRRTGPGGVRTPPGLRLHCRESSEETPADSCSDCCAPVNRARDQRWREIAAEPRELASPSPTLRGRTQASSRSRAVEGAARDPAGPPPPPAAARPEHRPEHRSECAPLAPCRMTSVAVRPEDRAGQASCPQPVEAACGGWWGGAARP